MGRTVQIPPHRQQPSEESNIDHSPVISSISLEARVGYLRRVASTSILGNSDLLRLGEDATVERGAFGNIYHKQRGFVGVIFLLIVSQCIQ